jgi:hypothetical protein
MKAKIVFLLAICFTSCSRNYGIVKAHVYFRESVPGTIRTNEFNQRLGSGIRKEYLVFVETDPSKPIQQWGNAWINKQGYLINPVQVENGYAVPGKKMGSQEEVVLKTENGNQLCQLVLTLRDSLKPTPVVQKKMNKYAIVLTGNWSGEPFEYKIRKPDTLARLVMQ